MKKPKIKNMQDFADVSGISRPTISRYFNDPNSVRQTTRAKIETAIKKYDYQPNVYAINQNRRSTKNIGIVVPYLADPFFAEFARKIEGFIVKTGFHPIPLSSHGDPDREIDNLNSLRAIKPAGVLLAPIGRASKTMEIADFCKNFKTVLFDCDLEGIGGAFVGTDHAKSIGQIIHYLCRSGEPPLYFEMKYPPNPNAYKHRKSYIETMETLGHRVELIQAGGSNWNFEQIGFEEGIKLFKDEYYRGKTILCGNDRLAIGLLSAAYESGWRVGVDKDADLRIAGHDDHPFSRYTSPTLTTMSQNFNDISQKSVDILINLIESDENLARERVLFDSTLVMRGSA